VPGAEQQAPAEGQAVITTDLLVGNREDSERFLRAVRADLPGPRAGLRGEPLLDAIGFRDILAG